MQTGTFKRASLPSGSRSSGARPNESRRTGALGWRIAGRFALVGAVAGAMVVGSPAVAGEPQAGSASSAKEHFEAGQALFDKKKYDAALVLFKQAYEGSKSPNAHLMMGRSLLALGRLPEAYDELIATMREAGARADTEPKYASARDAAAAEIAPLEAKVAKLVVTFSGPAPSGAVVKVNGAIVPAARLGTPMALSPGDVEIVGEGIDKSPVKRSEKLKAGETKTVVLTPVAVPSNTASPVSKGTAGASTTSAPTEAPTATDVSGPEAPKVGGTVRNVGFAVAGLGVVGMALFGVGTAVAQSKFDQLKTECGGVRCVDPKYSDVVDSGKTMDTLAVVGLGVGVAGLVGGAAMILFGGPKPAVAGSTPASSAGATPVLVVTPDGAMLRVSGSF